MKRLQVMQRSVILDRHLVNRGVRDPQCPRAKAYRGGGAIVLLPG